MTRCVAHSPPGFLRWSFPCRSCRSPPHPFRVMIDSLDRAARAAWAGVEVVRRGTATGARSPRRRGARTPAESMARPPATTRFRCRTVAGRGRTSEAAGPGAESVACNVQEQSNGSSRSLSAGLGTVRSWTCDEPPLTADVPLWHHLHTAKRRERMEANLSDRPAPSLLVWLPYLWRHV